MSYEVFKAVGVNADLEAVSHFRAHTVVKTLEEFAERHPGAVWKYDNAGAWIATENFESDTPDIYILRKPEDHGRMMNRAQRRHVMKG